VCESGQPDDHTDRHRLANGHLAEQQGLGAGVGIVHARVPKQQ
jgi:hypothetical protein